MHNELIFLIARSLGYSTLFHLFLVEGWGYSAPSPLKLYCWLEYPLLLFIAVFVS